MNQDNSEIIKKLKLPSTETSTETTTEKNRDIPEDKWFEYKVKAQPHHTDYSGVVWHGTYLTWLESARVELLSSLGIDFARLVILGCDLPIVELSMKYHRSVTLGKNIVVRTRLFKMVGVRIFWDQEIKSEDGQELFLTARIGLVGLDRGKGNIIRQLPTNLNNALMKIK